MVKAEARSKWECECGATYESPIEGTISVSHSHSSYEKSGHAYKATWRNKYDKVAMEERKQRVKGRVFYV